MVPYLHARYRTRLAALVFTFFVELDFCRRQTLTTTLIPSFVLENSRVFSRILASSRVGYVALFRRISGIVDLTNIISEQTTCSIMKPPCDTNEPICMQNHMWEYARKRMLECVYVRMFIYKRTNEYAHEHAMERDRATLHQCLTDITLCLSPECFRFQTPPLNTPLLDTPLLNTPLLDTPLLDHLVTILLYSLVHWRCRCKCRLVGEGLVIRRKEIVY